MDWTLTDLLLVTVLGAVVGFLSGVFGVGGGFLLVPCLNTFLGIPMPVSVGSAACYMLGPSTTAILGRRPSSGFIELPLILGGGLFAGVLIGVQAINRLESTQAIVVFDRHLPAVDTMVLVAYLILMTFICVMSFRDVASSSSREDTSENAGLFGRWLIPPVATIPDLRPGTYSIPLLAWTGLLVGLLSGFLGMSGGLILIPAAIYLLGMKVHDAATTTIGIVWLASFQATVVHCLNENVDVLLVSALLVGGTVGARFGTDVGLQLPAGKLKLGFALLVLVAVLVVAGKLGLLWQNARHEI